MSSPFQNGVNCLSGDPRRDGGKQRGQDNAMLETASDVLSVFKFEARVRQFQEGDWTSLLRESVVCAEVAYSSWVIAAVQMKRKLCSASFAPGNHSKTASAKKCSKSRRAGC